MTRYFELPTVTPLDAADHGRHLPAKLPSTMPILEDLARLGASLAPQALAFAEKELVSIVTGLAHTLEHQGTIAPSAVPQPNVGPHPVTGAVSDGTVGSTVLDVANVPPPSPAAASVDTSVIEASILSLHDQLQHLEIQLADAQKTQASAEDAEAKAEASEVDPTASPSTGSTYTPVVTPSPSVTNAPPVTNPVSSPSVTPSPTAPPAPPSAPTPYNP